MSKIFIFDADGVIIKLREKYFSERFSKDYGIDPELVIPLFKNEFYKCVLGALDLKEVLKIYLPKWDWKGSVEELLEYWWQGENKLDDSLGEFINTFREKGVKCYLATDQEKYRAEYLLNSVGLKNYFDGHFFSYQMHLSKNTKEFWFKVLEDLGSPDPKEVYFFDDEKENVESAKEAQINACLFEGLESLKSLNLS